MPLKSETIVEYYFNKPYMYYCQHHDCLRVADASGDSILHNNLQKDVINTFIENYIEYVLEDTDLKEAFKDSVKGESVMYLSKEENG